MNSYMKRWRPPSHNTYKCPALKHGIALTSIVDEFYHGTIEPCCKSAPSSFGPGSAAQYEYYSRNVVIPLGKLGASYHPTYPGPENHEGINSFDEIFTKYRNWADKEGYVNELVCDWCIKNAEDGHLPYNDYTPADDQKITVSDNDPNRLVFLGPLMLESTCNFSCYICGSSNSTQWASIADSIKDELNDANLSDEVYHIEDVYNSAHLSLNKSYSKKLKEVLYNTDMSYVKYVHIVGGEPLYGKMFPWFLELLDSRIDLSSVTLSFNTNISIFPNEKILNILRKFKEIRVCLSLDGVGKLQEATRPGVSWKETDANIEKWVAFRNTIHEIYPDTDRRIFLSLATTLSVLNINKMGDILNYAIEKDIGESLVSPETISVELKDRTGIINPIDLTLVQFKPYLDINLIPTEIRKKWLINKNNYPIEYHVAIEEYNDTILYNTGNHSTIDRCLNFLSIVGKATTTKFSDANPEIYECLQQLNE